MPFEPFAHAARTAPLFVPGLPASKAFAVSGNPATASTLTALSGGARDLPIPVVAIRNTQVVRNKFDGASIVIDLYTSYADTVSTDGVERLAQAMLAQLKAMSQGPLSLRELARRGHPYGRNGAGKMRGKLGRGYGVSVGVRGSAPNLAIVNQQGTGPDALANSWGYQITQRADGVRLELFNTSPESWWTAAGTKRMQAHGPYTFVVAQFRSRLLTEWRRTSLVAYHRQAALSATRMTLESAGAI